MYNKVTEKERKNIMAKNKTRKLKRYKNKNTSQLIKIIACQNKKQDKLLQRIEDLEEYISFIEEVYIDDDGDVLISGAVFEADDAFEQILQDQLNETQNDKLEEVKKDKKKKNKKPKLHSMDDILKVFKDE